MMQIQKFIKEHGFEALVAEPLNIKIRTYPQFGLYMLNYDQISSPKSDPISMECRSLILDLHGNVVSRSFDRFFNHGEMPDFYSDFDINRAQVFTKEDGSLIKVYWCDATVRWEISTRSQAFAEGEHQLGGTFRDYVLKAMKLTEDQFQSVMNNVDFVYDIDDCTFIMEYVGPSNRIVRQYAQNEMVMLSVRNNQTGEYLDVDTVDNITTLMSNVPNIPMNIRMVQTYVLDSFEAVIEAAKNLPCLEEGYVCFDPVSNKRVKLKNPSYVAVHHLRDNGTPSMKRILTLVLENEQDEYLGYFEEDRPLFEPAIAEVEAFKAMLTEVWETVKDIENQKDFAMKVKDLKGSGFFFNAKKLKVTPVHAFDAAEMNKRLSVFGF